MLQNKSYIEEKLRNVIEELNELSKNGSILRRMSDGSLTFSTDVFAVVKTLNKSGLDAPSLKGALINTCQQSEKVAAGSTKYLLKTLSQVQKQLNDGLNVDVVVDKLKNVYSNLSSISQAASNETLKECLEATAPDVSELVIEAIKLAGNECKIFIESSATDTTTLERIDGNTFNVSVDPLFLKGGKWSALSAKVFIIDGMIEKISEIDSLLEACNRLKQPVCIIARGYDKDVISTLFVNYTRKTLNVIPATLAFDLETANVLNDIAVALGGDVTSSLKGDLISTVKLDDLPRAKVITCTGKSLTIVPDVSGDVINHIRNLIEKRETETLVGVKLILDKRIRSLSSSSVIIRVSDRGAQGSKIMHDIDACLKITKNVLQYGVIMPEFIDISGDMAIIKDIIDAPCATLTLAAGFKHAYEFMQTFLSAGMIVY